MFSKPEDKKALNNGLSIGMKLILVVIIGAVLSAFLPTPIPFIVAVVCVFAPSLGKSAVTGTAGVIGFFIKAIFQFIGGLLSMIAGGVQKAGEASKRKK